jgi:DNA processing protein
VVSGLARGIDAAAHRGALEAPGRTVAVLGSGLDCVYPPENAGLADSIVARGAVVSECPLGSGPRRESFPRRNRIIAGWGVAVVVVEAPEKSGALITARVALEEGRDVLAVPGHPASALAAGTNELIRSGAGLVRHAGDVAAEMGLPLPALDARRERPAAGHVLAALLPGSPANIDELQERCGRPMGELLSELSELEVLEKVQRLPGGLFVRS